MYKIFILLFAVVVSAKESDNNPAAQQLLRFRNQTKRPIGILTTSSGAPVEFHDTHTLNSDLIRNLNFMESLAQLVRERIPERPVHAKGAGAFGYFEVTHDITHICKAKLFAFIGKRTPVAVRFSPVTIERGGIDTSRDTKGFAIKFYTEDGNYDLIGQNIPLFALKNPLFFPNLIHAIKRNPVTNLVDKNMFWDFVTRRPEVINTFILTFGDGGIQDGYRHMPGFGIHTFQVVNDAGEVYFIRYHLHPDVRIRNISAEEAQRLAGEEPDYATKDLYNAIANGKYPSWTVSIQILTLDDVKKADFDVFDPTRKLPERKYPLCLVGKLILNKNPKNYFADIEQLLFNPGNLVPGIVGAPDKLFQARLLAYRDSAHYRLGINFNNIPVNCPIRVKKLNYLRDGRAPVNKNGGGTPNYYPNYFNGPKPCKDKKRVELLYIFQDDAIDFSQAREIYLNEMTDDERSRLVQNIVVSLREVIPAIKEKVVYLFNAIHTDFGRRVCLELQANPTQMPPVC